MPAQQGSILGGGEMKLWMKTRNMSAFDKYLLCRIFFLEIGKFEIGKLGKTILHIVCNRFQNTYSSLYQNLMMPL